MEKMIYEYSITDPLRQGQNILTISHQASTMIARTHDYRVKFSYIIRIEDHQVIGPGTGKYCVGYLGILLRRLRLLLLY